MSRRHRAAEKVAVGSEIAYDEHGYDMPDSQVRDWNDWSSEVGNAVLPKFLELKDRLPSMTAAMLCTADGLNLCAVGVGEEQVGHLAALNSSLYAVAAAHTEAIQGAPRHAGDLINVSTQIGHVVVAGIAPRLLGPMLLSVAATDASLGLIHQNVRVCAEELLALLDTEQLPALPQL